MDSEQKVIGCWFAWFGFVVLSGVSVLVFLCYLLLRLVNWITQHA